MFFLGLNIVLHILYTMKILVFDTETTGLPERNSSIYDTHKWPHILQLSYILFDMDSNVLITHKNDYVAISSTVEISEESTKIHNISRETCNRLGKHIRQVLNEFNICLQKADLIVGHNISFDKRMIFVECHRNKIPQYFTHYDCGNKIQKPEYCTMKKSVELCKLPYKTKLPEIQPMDFGPMDVDPGVIEPPPDETKITKIRYKYPTLHELYFTLFNLTPQNLHNAMVDILITLRCYVKIMTTVDVCTINAETRDLFVQYGI